MYKNIIFDVDGTLINTQKVTIEGLRYVLEQENISKSFEELMQYDGLPSLEVLKNFHISNIEEAKNKWHLYVEEHTHDFSIYYGIESVLKLLQIKGIPMSIVTSRSREEIEYDPQLNGLLDYFDLSVSFDETSSHKPHPAPILYALDHQQYLASETLYIGDSIYDYKACLSSGVSFGKALWGHKQFNINKEHYEFKTPIDILEYIS